MGDSFGTSNSALSNELLHATKDHINSSNIVDIIRYLKRHESFRGRLDFKQFNSIFKFENSIYSDKVLSYENLKRMNSDIIVDFASSVLTRFIYRDFTSKDIRKHIEQYFIAIMTSLDYFLYPDILLLKNEDFRVEYSSYGAVMGSMPDNFHPSQHKLILNSRIYTAQNYIGELTLDKTFLITTNEDYLELKKANYDGFENLLCNNESDPQRRLSFKKNKTKENIDKILKHMLDDGSIVKDRPWELIVFTSTFHIIKTAIELEKYLLEEHPSYIQSENKKLGNLARIVIIGDDQVYDLMKGLGDKNETDNDKLRKRKLKCFLFELYKHALDRNLD